MDLLEEIKKESINLGIDGINFGTVQRLIEYQNIFKDVFPSPLIFFPNAKIYISANLSFRENWNLVNSDIEGYIARYTTANFYKILSKKLESLAKFIKKIVNSKIENSNFYRIFINSKINDKLACYVSGAGYYAPNSLIFIEDKGTNFVLGEIFLDLDMDIKNKNFQENFCINCNICVDSCPTKAIKNFKIDKSLCLQHLSSVKDFPLNREIIKIWGKRFFGCSECVDNCPMNKNNIKYNNEYQEYAGFIGTTFRLNNLEFFTKEDYKNYFKGNQIGAKWIEPVVLARNILISLYNSDKKELINKYKNKLKDYNWDENDIFYLKNICDFLLKL